MIGAARGVVIISATAELVMISLVGTPSDLPRPISCPLRLI